MRAAWLALILLGFVRSADAHPLDMGYLRINASGKTLAVVLDIDVAVAEQLVGVAEGGMNAAAAEARASDLADATYRMAQIITDAGACSWTSAPTAGLKSTTTSITGEAECPAGASTLRWAFPFIEKMPETFQLLIKVQGFAGDRVAIVDRSAPMLELTSVEFDPGFGEFVWSGVAHIGAARSEWYDADGWKLPEGIDHILFLLALLLGGGTLLQLAGIATAFTLGHSVTLAIAALDVVRPPASVIEPLIALTIALTAVEAFSGKLKRHRWKIATAFGFIHGFAFASALTELELAGGALVEALLGYNVGVELGQLVFVLLFAGPIIWLHRRPSAARIVVRGTAAAIFVSGMYWFLERTFA